jgi:hypothetical protein
MRKVESRENSVAGRKRGISYQIFKTKKQTSESIEDLKTRFLPKTREIGFAASNVQILEKKVKVMEMRQFKERNEISVFLT